MTNHPTGLLVFRTLAEALGAGFQIYDRTPTGYLVRIRTSAGWALALVEFGVHARDDAGWRR